MCLLTLLYNINLDAQACDAVTKKANLAIGPFYSIITVFDIIPLGSHNPAGIPGLEIPQSRIPRLRKWVRDWNPYILHTWRN